ncbi:MAG: hypothetical protein HYS08_07090 [Chlamydiae bacterium]|nr:hypothetical protein [Chlamydiota bacterium]MBI3265921.1 hypothetical protein [Chlamydiota bacterium]
MKKNTWVMLGLVSIALATSGCTQTEEGATGGALAGGAVGAIIGHQSGNTGAGAAIGAVGGGVIGGLIGNSEERKNESAHRVQQCPQGHDVDVTGYASGSQVRCPIDNSTFTVQ